MKIFKFRVVLDGEYKKIINKISLYEKCNKSLAEDLKVVQNEKNDLSQLINKLQDDKNCIVKKYNDLSKRKNKLRGQVNELKKDLSSTLEQLKLEQLEKQNIIKEFVEFKKTNLLLKSYLVQSLEKHKP